MESFDREDLHDLHYSSIVSLSMKDAIKLKDNLLERLEGDVKLIRDSAEEELYCLCLDWFSLKR